MSGKYVVCPECKGALTRAIGCLDDGSLDEYICDDCGITFTDYSEGLEMSQLPHRRYLCYKHHCQEFDKLPNTRRHEASWWVTCEPESCEVCSAPQEATK